MAYPLASAAFVVLLVAIALLSNGIASIIAGLSGEKNHKEKNGRNNTPSRGSRALSVVARALAVGLSILILASPLFGIVLLVYGIRLLVTGISGRKETVTSASSS